MSKPSASSKTREQLRADLKEALPGSKLSKGDKLPPQPSDAAKEGDTAQ